MRTPGDSAMLCRFAHVQSVTFFAHAVVCTVILRRDRGSATFGPGRPRHTHATSEEGAVGTAGQCGGCRRDCRAWPPTTHPRHQCEGCRRDRRAVWKVPAGPQGLAGLRDDAPSHRRAARTARGRAGPTAPGTPATQPQPRCLRAAAGPGRPRHTHATSVEGADGPRCIPGCLRAAAGPGHPRHTPATSVEGAGGTAGPGRASSRRAELQARGADGERAGGPDGTRNIGDAATTSSI